MKYNFIDGNEKVFLTSDLHLCHDRQFVYKPRGFNSIDEMNEAIVENWNKTVGKDDWVFVLGDLIVNDNEKGMELLGRLNGRLVVVIGNHDTDNRIELYKTLPNVEEVCYATTLRYKKLHFYLSHYPTITGSMEAGSLHNCVINLHGHRHTKEKFLYDMPFMINVILDAWNNTPVNIEQIIEEAKAKVEECRQESL